MKDKLIFLIFALLGLVMLLNVAFSISSSFFYKALAVYDWETVNYWLSVENYIVHAEIIIIVLQVILLIYYAYICVKNR